MNDNKTVIRSFFARFFRIDDLQNADDIFSSARVNSLFAMQLIAWLEKDCAVTVEDEDLNISNFNSVDAIAAFIDRKRGLTLA